MGIESTLNLNNATKIPILGLGTWRMFREECERAVSYALEIGYRHIDTARIYRNEKSVGKAIRNSGIPREQIFVTTKIFNHQHRNPAKALDKSLQRLELEYIDLYLIHWPVPQRHQTWKVLEEQYQLGKCHAIGVSNFTIRHLQELLSIAKIPPAVNQVEFSPFLYQRDLLNFCNQQNIMVEAYSPLTHGSRLNHPTIVELADKYSKTPAQILLRWVIQHGMIVLPKSSHQERIKENADIFDFEITSQDMQKLNQLDEGFRVTWDPSDMS